jgi:hypothetical protein
LLIIKAKKKNQKDVTEYLHPIWTLLKNISELGWGYYPW